MNTAICLVLLGISTAFGYDVASAVRSYGYTFDKYSVTTEDGYVLELHRISESPHGQNPDNRPPVLIMHGLLGCSADYIHIGSRKALPLRLSDEGYDVWLGNNRGNTYSQKHNKMNFKDANFWNYSFHEVGLIDTPAMIDFILETTGANNLSYIGHSTGVAQYLITAVLKPEYQAKVNILAALAPVVYLDHTSSLLLTIVNKEVYGYILAGEQAINATYLLDHNSLIWDVGLSLICGNHKTQEFCADLIFFLTGSDSEELDRSEIVPFFSTFPAGMSAKELNHVLQWKLNGKFGHYDYGMVNNSHIYNSTRPPIYNLTEVNVPVALFYAQNDFISTYTDVKHLESDLPNVVESHLIEYEKFNHIDFLLAKDIDTLLNYHVINTLNLYNGKSNISSTIEPDSTTTLVPPTTIKGSSSNNVPLGAIVFITLYFCIKMIF